MKRSSVIALFLAILLIAATRQPVTVEQGETIVLTANTGSRDATDTIAAEFSIPRTEVNYYLTETSPDSPTIRQRVAFDLEPGQYEMRIRTWVNNEITSYDIQPITVRSSRPAETAGEEEEADGGTIHIDPIPDATPGSTFIVPVRITGNGDYLVEVPRLPFGTYEVPETMRIEGTDTVPVLLHIDEDAEPGIYAIPIRVGEEQATARLRIIKYAEEEKENLWWILIPLGILIIVIGLLVLFSRRSPPPKRIEPVPPPKSGDTELITYY